MALRAGWRRARASSIIIALLVGLTGGFAIAAASTASQIDSAFDALLREIDAPDLIVIPECSTQSMTGCYAPDEDGATRLAQLSSIDGVEQARVVEVVRPHLLGVDGTLLLATDDNPTGCFDGDRSPAMIAAVDGTPADQAVPFKLLGDMPAPNSTEVVLTRATARRVGLAAGDELVLAGWCTGDGDAVELDTPIELVVSGLSIGPLDVEPPGTGISVEPTYVDPGVFDVIVEAGAETSLNSVVWLADGSVEATTRTITGYDGLIDIDEQASNIDRALDTDARPLWIMAVSALVVGLLVLTPIIDRRIVGNAGDITAVAALGASRSQRSVYVAAHVTAVCTAGLLIALVAAAAIRSRLPLGLGAAIVTDRGSGWDPAVTLAGVALLMVALGAVIAVSTWRSERPDLQRTSPATIESRRPSSSVHLRPAGQTGLLAAIGRPAGRRLANPWPGIVSLALAVAVSVAGFTYVAGLRHFESTPRLTGWNWDMVVEIEGSPQQRATTMERITALDNVGVATTGTFFPPVFLSIPDTDLQVWPWSYATGVGAVTPTMIDGRAPQGPDEIAIDAVFAEFTGKAIGDTVVLSRPTLTEQFAEQIQHEEIVVAVPNTARVTSTFEVTGLAVFANDRTSRFPQASFTLGGYAEFIAPTDEEIADVRGWVPPDLPGELLGEIEQLLADPSLDDRVAYVRTSSDVSALARRIEATEGVAGVFAIGSDDVLGLLNGINVSDNDRAPATLAVMGLIASIALGLYLLATGMWARRSELSVLRALGLSGTGVRASFVVQAFATIAMVAIVAIPIGVMAGQWAWTNYARDLEVVEEPVAPTSVLATGTCAALVVSVAAATIVGGFVTRRSAAERLRAE